MAGITFQPRTGTGLPRLVSRDPLSNILSVTQRKEKIIQGLRQLAEKKVGIYADSVNGLFNEYNQLPINSSHTESEHCTHVHDIEAFYQSLLKEHTPEDTWQA